ncbi:MAG: hypothetical protein ACRDJP_05175 [Actinomycetota bacterium]
MRRLILGTLTATLLLAGIGPAAADIVEIKKNKVHVNNVRLCNNRCIQTGDINVSVPHP